AQGRAEGVSVSKCDGATRFSQEHGTVVERFPAGPPSSGMRRMSDERIFRSPAQLKAELAQRHAELLTDAEFTRGVLANSSEAIMVLDLDARIAFASAGALRAIAVDDPAALVGTSWPALWR